MKLQVVLTVLLVLTLGYSEAKVFTRCELARELRKWPDFFTLAKINDWVCLIERESGRNTRAKGGPNPNGTFDYGLFQINNQYWCGAKGPGKDCKVACSALLNDNIKDDVACAKIIYKRHGFNAWYGWKNHCRGAKANVVKECRLK